MDELVILKGNEVFTDSLVITNGTGIEHRATQQLIKNYKNDIKDFGKITFEMRPLVSGQKTKVYLLNEEQATFLISLMKNTKVVVQFKKELVRQFYSMRKFILERQSNEWVATRKQSKLTRKAETDTLKKLIEYAKSKGSENADNYYKAYTVLANKIAGINTRDEASISQLNNLSLIENIILHVIDTGIMADKPYKEIYQDCKKRLEMFRDLAYLTA